MGFFDFSWAGKKGFPLLRALMHPHYEVARMDGDERPFQGATKAWTIGALVMTSGYQRALRFTRTPQLIRADQHDELLLQLVRRGTVVGDFDGTEARASSGDLLCYTGDGPPTSAMETMSASR